jgi:hypothetical protein
VTGETVTLLLVTLTKVVVALVRLVVPVGVKTTWIVQLCPLTRDAGQLLVWVNSAWFESATPVMASGAVPEDVTVIEVDALFPRKTAPRFVDFATSVADATACVIVNVAVFEGACPGKTTETLAVPAVATRAAGTIA